jgi:hypothetical protein
MLYAQVHLTLPSWIHQEVDAQAVYGTDAEKWPWRHCRRECREQTGGPFGAAVFSGEGPL